MEPNGDKQPTPTASNEDERKAPLAILNQVHSDLALAIALHEADVAATSANASNEDEDEEEWSDSETEDEDEEYGNEYEFFDSQGVEEQEDDEMSYEEDEVDPDDMSYEDMVALGEVVGEEKRGLTAEEIAAAGCLRKRKFAELDGDVEMCVICQEEYVEDEVAEVVEIVGCGHAYHEECVTNWLLIKKSCPVCGFEVDPSPPSVAATTAGGCKECGSGDGNGGDIGGG